MELYKFISDTEKLNTNDTFAISSTTRMSGHERKTANSRFKTKAGVSLHRT